MRWRARTIVQLHCAQRASRPQLKRGPLGAAFTIGFDSVIRRSLAILVLGSAPVWIAHAQNPLVDADSVVLERTGCFGSCPAYVLHVSRSGAVLFESRTRRDEVQREKDTIPAYKFQRILAQVLLVDFLVLPDQIQRNNPFCPYWRTDAPTAIVTVFLPRTAKRVEDYHGCFYSDSVAPTRGVGVMGLTGDQARGDARAAKSGVDRVRRAWADLQLQMSRLRQLEDMVDTVAGASRWVARTRRY